MEKKVQDLSHIPIFVKQSDYQVLTEFIARNRSDAAKDLQSELDRAEIVPDRDYNNDFVCVDSQVTFIDLDLLSQTKVTLVMPWQANVTQLKISVLSPVGCALLGLRKGNEIEWPLLNGKVRRLSVQKIEIPQCKSKRQSEKMASVG
ncbi:MAG: regulator of nucleoside diphosphate kinase [Zhongshania marina]|jgi:regulator of nucleoside diphosphate kinase|uniref:Nucleoside diphosphate kinase regulator n=1 Tax=Zhongshania marina TaxID=2304603 RepID=A0A2S4HCR4_9GAMM|nr:nucleoside diphosphate kinase regulator [Marortus luteolus]RNL61439.1 nucleoside diphosphate kinase regulator [Zhongshania marina]|tara:strand:- start:5 stop:445 length:441 start_codon:yes stop_codon:yes gene_type:complete